MATHPRAELLEGEMAAIVRALSRTFPDTEVNTDAEDHRDVFRSRPDRLFARCVLRFGFERGVFLSVVNQLTSDRPGTCYSICAED